MSEELEPGSVGYELARIKAEIEMMPEPGRSILRRQYDALQKKIDDQRDEFVRAYFGQFGDSDG